MWLVRVNGVVGLRRGLKTRSFLLVAIALLMALPILPAHSINTSGKYFDHIVVIMLENKSLSQINSVNTPYLHGFAVQYSNATERTAIDHPSEPNYLALGSGLAGDCLNPNINIGGCMPGSGASGLCDTQGTVPSGTCSSASYNGSVGDCSPDKTGSCFMGEDTNLVDLLGNSSLSYSFYLEGETDQTCGTSFTTAYHAWPLFFNDFVQHTEKCNKVHSFVTTNPTGLISNLNNTMDNLIWVNPDNSHNCHNSGDYSCDSYMSTLIPSILTTKMFEDTRAALLVTFDEGGTGNNYPSDYVYTVFAGPAAKPAYSAATFYTSYSILRTIEDNWNLSPLQSTDSNASVMSEFFTGVGNFGACGSLPSSWYCQPTKNQGSGTGSSTIESNGAYRSVLSNEAGDSNNFANSTIQRGTFPWTGAGSCSSASAPASGVFGQSTGQVSAIFDALSVPNTGRFHIYVALYYWLSSSASVGGHTSQCLDTHVRVEYKSGQFTSAINSTSSTATWFASGTASAFGWNRTIGSINTGEIVDLSADVSSQCKQDEIAWGISLDHTCQIAGVEIGIEGFGFTSQTLNVLWLHREAVWTTFHAYQGDINEDCAINVLDLAEVAYQYNTEAGTAFYNRYSTDFVGNAQGRTTGDGIVNILDLAKVAIDYGNKCS